MALDIPCMGEFIVTRPPKEEPDYDSNECHDIKEEIVSIVDDDGCFVDASVGCEKIKTEFVEFDNENEPIEEKPLTVCLVDDDGKVLETFIKLEGQLCKVEDKSTEGPSANKKSVKKTGKIKTKKDGKRLNLDKLLKKERYSCTLCDSVFLGRQSYRGHLKQHVGTCGSRYRCPLCAYATPARGTVNRHIMQAHAPYHIFNIGDERFHSCSKCGKSFFEKNDLVKHMYVHTREGPYKCSLCDFSHVRRYGIDKHMVTHTDNKVPKGRKLLPKGRRTNKYECDECGYRSDCKAHLITHINSVHLGVHLYRCEECGYSCSYKGDLSKHLTIHSTARPFVCSHCEKTFKRRAHLLSHLSNKKSCKNELERKKKEIKEEQ